MLAIPVGLITVVAIAVMAYHGKGTRPLYLAAMVIALACAAACNAMIPSQIDMLRYADDPAQRAGSQLFFNYGHPRSSSCGSRWRSGTCWPSSSTVTQRSQRHDHP